ncbi:MAG: AAA family ATPase, partial [Gaiellaceae bacterium]
MSAEPVEVFETADQHDQLEDGLSRTDAPPLTDEELTPTGFNGGGASFGAILFQDERERQACRVALVARGIDPDDYPPPEWPALLRGGPMARSWEPRNLSLVEPRPPVRPTLGTLGLLYPGRRHILSGPPESLKTLLALIELLAVIRAGRRVVLVDLETGPWDTRDRLRDLGTTEEEIAAVLYVEPDTAPTADTISGLAAFEPDLVILDAAAGCYDLAGLDDNKRSDVERFATLYVRGFWQAGIATLLLDHVVKNTETRGRYAIGSERKLGGCDVHLGVDALKPLSRGHHGLAKITVHKDRIGHLLRPVAGVLRLTSDPDTHAIGWELEPDTSTDTDDRWRPTVLMGKVSEFLAGQTEPVSQTTIEKANLGKQVTYIRNALNALIADGNVTVTEGPRKARLCTLVKPFTPPGLTPSDPVSPR